MGGGPAVGGLDRVARGPKLQGRARGGVSPGGEEQEGRSPGVGARAGRLV